MVAATSRAPCNRAARRWKTFDAHSTWDEFVKLKATDAELKKFVASHHDLVGGTLLKASHIFLYVPGGATTADTEKLRQKLVALKQDIVDKKISFAAAANASSEDPANAEGSGGDIGYFGLNTGIAAEFADAAFALKPGAISDPVETVHGLHLITVTDRKDGKAIEFDPQNEQLKQYVLGLCAADVRKQILAAERKSALEKHSLEIQPMPPDLFPPTPPATSCLPPWPCRRVSTRRTPPAPSGSVPGAKP